MTEHLSNAASCALVPPSPEVPGLGGSEDARLLARIRDGDQSACEALVRQHAGLMLAVARRFLRTEEDSADAVQDAFLSAFRYLACFQGNSALGTWLHRIVVNVCLMRLRVQSRCREIRIDDLLPTFDETGRHRRPVRPWEDQTLVPLTQAETTPQVRACIDRLPYPYRQVLLLRNIEELDTQRTAQHLDISTGAVKTRLHRPRQALRTLLEPVVFGKDRWLATA